MELLKYKICPACGKHNAPTLLECRYCETDLTGIRVVDSGSEIDEQSNEVLKQPKTTTSMVRICDCGAKNVSQARKCSVCGEDISDIVPVQDGACNPESVAYELVSVDGTFSVCIDKPTCIIGREAELAEYLSGKVYVSRQHARISIAHGKVCIENLSGTNHTFINDIQIQCSSPAELNDGDEIGLGGRKLNGERQNMAAYLLIRIKV